MMMNMIKHAIRHIKLIMRMIKLIIDSMGGRWRCRGGSGVGTSTGDGGGCSGGKMMMAVPGRRCDGWGKLELAMDVVGGVESGLSETVPGGGRRFER